LYYCVVPFLVCVLREKRWKLMDLPNEHVTIWEWNSTVFAYASRLSRLFEREKQEFFYYLFS
jgi:hypothetical protein